ncbi:hypothetical protein G5714_000803 [Onychostoma macrolepis]|uniref:Uncharacterized protein n=1 Tax=Onychostoma macrolepis TaxID=369639 RepID=A0A7J6DHD5_9TELE|nr:hypothetical protein G5714_000803 [Onychostoma macrolepis]
MAVVIMSLKPDNSARLLTLLSPHIPSCSQILLGKEEQPKPLERRKTRQNIRSDPREVDQSSDEDDIIPVTWSQGEPVQEVTRYIVSRDVPRHHGPSHSKENLMTDLNKVTDDVPDNVSSLPDVTPVNRVTLDLNLPGNEPVERETNLSDSDDLVEGSDEDCPEQLPVPPICQNVMRQMSMKMKEKRRLRRRRNKHILMT